MVVAQRIAALQQFIWDGHQVNITYSYSDISKKLKAKVFVSAMSGIVPLQCRHILLAALQPILDSMWNSVIVDRGHTFSDGHACACFWIEPCCTEPLAVIGSGDTPANVETVLDYLTATPSATVVSGHGTRPKKPAEPRPPTARPNRSRKRVSLVTEDEFVSRLEQMIAVLATPFVDSFCDCMEQYPGGLTERTSVEGALVWSVQKALQPYREKLLEDFGSSGRAALVTRTWDNLRNVLAPLVHKKAGQRWFCTGKARREDVREDA